MLETIRWKLQRKQSQLKYFQNYKTNSKSEENALLYYDKKVVYLLKFRGIFRMKHTVFLIAITKVA